MNGKAYPNDSEIPSEDACRICKCIDSEMVCADEVCDEPEGGCERMPPTKDECCNYECKQEDAVSTVRVTARR